MKLKELIRQNNLVRVAEKIGEKLKINKIYFAYYLYYNINGRTL